MGRTHSSPSLLLSPPRPNKVSLPSLPLSPAPFFGLRATSVKARITAAAADDDREAKRRGRGGQKKLDPCKEAALMQRGGRGTAAGLAISRLRCKTNMRRNKRWGLEHSICCCIERSTEMRDKRVCPISFLKASNFPFFPRRGLLLLFSSVPPSFPPAIPWAFHLGHMRNSHSLLLKGTTTGVCERDVELTALFVKKKLYPRGGGSAY